MRPLCQVCQTHPRAVAYHRQGRVYYRSRCNQCMRKGKRLKPGIPRWQSKGYKKKPACDRCGFRAWHPCQLLVYHVNGNLNDCELRNLKSICLNCAALIERQDLSWAQGDLEPDQQPADRGRLG